MVLKLEQNICEQLGFLQHEFLFQYLQIHFRNLNRNIEKILRSFLGFSHSQKHLLNCSFLVKTFNTFKALLTHSLAKNKILSSEIQTEKERKLSKEIYALPMSILVKGSSLLFHSLKYFMVNILGWISHWPDFYLLNVKVFFLSCYLVCECHRCSSSFF